MDDNRKKALAQALVGEGEGQGGDLGALTESQLQAVSSPRVIVPLQPDAPVGEPLRGFAEVELMLAPEAVYEILFHDLGQDVAFVVVPAQVPLPVDIPISAADTRLWVDTFMDGKTRIFGMDYAF